MHLFSSINSAVKSGRAREIIETRFGHWGKVSYDHAKIIIACIAVIIIGLSTQLHKIELETSTEAFLHEDDPVRVAYNQFRYQYGRDDKVLILIETENVFTFNNLNKLKQLHETLEQNVSRLEEVESLINARQTIGIGDELVVKDFLQDWPENEQALEQLKQQALNNPVYINTFISEDGRYAAIMLQTDVFSEVDETDVFAGFDEFDSDSDVASEATAPQLTFLSGEENAVIVSEITELVKDFDSDDFQIHLLGPPYMGKLVMDIMREDLAKYAGGSTAIIALLLALLYRRWSMIILPLSVSLLAMLSTMAIMAMMGMKLSNSIQIMPSFLIAVGVGNSVHLFTMFYQSLSRGNSKRQALSDALEHAGLAIVMTSLTTAGGLLSFTISDVKVVADFGTITPIGVVVTLFFSIMFLPALIAVCPLKDNNHAIHNQQEQNNTQRQPKNVIRKILVRFAYFSSTHPLAVIGMWLSFLTFGLFYAVKIQFSHNPIEWFPHEHPFYLAMEKVGEDFGGSTTLEVLIDSGRVDGFKDPAMLKKLDAIHQYMKSFEYEIPDKTLRITKTLSVVDINKELHQALNSNDPDYYRIPDDKQLVAQELLLFENSGADDLENLVDTTFQTARLTLKKPSVDSVHYPPMEDKLRADIEAILDGSATVEFTGVFAMMGRVLHNLTYSLAQTYILAFIVITPLMIFLIGSFKMGLLSMIPNLTPIAITVGMMSLCDIPMDISTLMVGSVALGLAVDDTIHFMHNYQRFYLRYGDNARAIRETLTTTGHALFFTTLSLSLAFLIYTASAMTNLQYFGILTSFCITIAFLADVTFAPALVTLANRKDNNKKESVE